MVPEVIKTSFYNFGLGIGLFLMKKFFLKKFADFIDTPDLILCYMPESVSGHGWNQIQAYT